MFVSANWLLTLTLMGAFSSSEEPVFSGPILNPASHDSAQPVIITTQIAINNNVILLILLEFNGPTMNVTQIASTIFSP